MKLVDLLTMHGYPAKYPYICPDCSHTYWLTPVDDFSLVPDESCKKALGKEMAKGQINLGILWASAHRDEILRPINQIKQLKALGQPWIKHALDFFEEEEEGPKGA
jgi:hypothetical protein